MDQPEDIQGRAGAAAPIVPGPIAAAPTEAVPIVIANEFAEVRVRKVETRNGARLCIESPRTGQAVFLCPLELEALTWQDTNTFSEMIGHPQAPLFSGDDSRDDD